MPESVASRIRSRLNFYLRRFQVNNYYFGAIVEKSFNRTRIDGAWISLDCPAISRGHKSTIFWGLHELDERQLIAKWLPSTHPVIELGGGLGVTACLTNSLLQDPTHHCVVEANPSMIDVLSRNRDWNKHKFEIKNAALAYGVSAVAMQQQGDFVAAKLGNPSDSALIPTTCLEKLIERYPNNRAVSLVCDIEGGEIELLKNEPVVLQRRVHTMIVELHPRISGWSSCRWFLARMSNLGFAKVDRAGDNLVFRNLAIN